MTNKAPSTFKGSTEHVVNNVLEHHFTNAKDFLDAFDPTNDAWDTTPGDACNWVFRGQAIASWRLVPRAWRDETQNYLREFNKIALLVWEQLLQHSRYVGFREKWQRECFAQYYTEIRAIYEFAQLADEIGLHVPDILLLDKNVWGNTYQPLNLPYNLDRQLELPSPTVIALAQHHSIPTRLLDFTRRGDIACFFAIQDIPKPDPSRDQQLAVWALYVPDLHPSLNAPIALLTCPRNSSPYLHAQDAVLAFSPTAVRSFLSCGAWPALDELFLANTGSTCTIRKLLLPRTEAENLEKLLRTRRITCAHLMPSYDSVTRSLKSKWGWKSST